LERIAFLTNDRPDWIPCRPFIYQRIRDGQKALLPETQSVPADGALALSENFFNFFRHIIAQEIHFVPAKYPFAFYLSFLSSEKIWTTPQNKTLQNFGTPTPLVELEHAPPPFLLSRGLFSDLSLPGHRASSTFR